LLGDGEDEGVGLGTAIGLGQIGQGATHAVEVGLGGRWPGFSSADRLQHIQAAAQPRPVSRINRDQVAHDLIE